MIQGILQFWKKLEEIYFSAVIEDPQPLVQ